MFKPEHQGVGIEFCDCLPAETGGAVTLQRNGRLWIILSPGIAGRMAVRFIDVTACEEWKQWGIATVAAGHMISVHDMMRRFDLSEDVALWAFWEFAGEVLLLQKMEETRTVLAS